ncbi:hypothetical protein K437DRAFT_257996 [Tilletiaria anomala UBC 951]|uniref:Uncharacterized protein n=1 Tax=Tilletiaria anomala (strain ATCC 24038 / CBS 436.72 / UBC 951) TaxID=1037660 RepID=A0A066VKP5_TILAU|nr:uncharacterized protein K437DRAFT_257996 [Tilletiaria anomala UBC 951]KDN42066.1 hypothetical protein K437DRAFT_257996 [Tilletiaria anomala UBC 951]
MATQDGTPIFTTSSPVPLLSPVFHRPDPGIISSRSPARKAFASVNVQDRHGSMKPFNNSSMSKHRKQ